jgi:hypothetical protein
MKKLPIWAEIFIFVVALVIVSFLAIFLPLYFTGNSNTTVVTVTPSVTVTVIPVIFGEDVTITTKLPSNEVVCIAFDNTSTLQYGNCGNTNIQGSWLFNNVSFLLTNTLTLTSKSNCMINLSTIVNPTILGQVISGSTAKCNGVKLENGFISATNNNQTVWIGFVGSSLVWVSNIQFAQPFEFQFS